MAVAVLPSQEKPQLRETTLPQAVLYGTLFVLAGAWAVYFGIPFVWESYLGANLGLNPLYNNGLRLVVMALAAFGLLVWGTRSLPDQPGVRAGIFLGVVGVIVGFFLVLLSAFLAEGLCRWLGLSPYVGIPIPLAVAFLLFRWLLRSLHTSRGQKLLVQLDHQGWFQRGTYKKGQGLRVRRLTMLGILLIVGSGIFIYGWRRSYHPGEVWAVHVPFTTDYELVLLRAPGFVFSVLVILGTLWFIYRLVNYPRFADFLIATEAEMNKVSWASPKRLKQDTIVVLVTTVLLTLFLWFMDIFWSWLLVMLGVIKITAS